MERLAVRTRSKDQEREATEVRPHAQWRCGVDKTNPSQPPAPNPSSSLPAGLARNTIRRRGNRPGKCAENKEARKEEHATQHTAHTVTVVTAESRTVSLSLSVSRGPQALSDVSTGADTVP